MSSEAKRMKTDETWDTSWSLTPILSDELLADVPLVDALVDKIKNKKYISSIISHLNKIFPVPTLQHLKRVRGNEILIDLAGVDKTDQKQSFRERIPKVEAFTLGLALDPYISQVPAWQPRTKAQFRSCHRVWPCNFHPDQTLEETISGEKFSQDDLNTMETWMKACLELCEYSGVGCVIVDPATNQLVASGVDERLLHPMKHAAMVAVDNVAKTQQGGAWDVESLQVKSEAAISTDIALGKLQEAESVSNINNTDTKTDGASKEVKEDDKLQVENNKDCREPKEKQKSKDGDQLEGPYLCTGYDVYITTEPCLMCAMALVHSRVKRVFYGCPNRTTGALGNKLKLHTVPNLNHHYEVYAGLLESQCERALAKSKPEVIQIS